MSAAIELPGNTASTFLISFFGSGLADDTHVVERFKAWWTTTSAATPASRLRRRRGGAG